MSKFLVDISVAIFRFRLISYCLRSTGLPIVCHDTRGFGIIVDDKIGRKVEIKNPERSVREFAKIIDDLLNRIAMLSANFQLVVLSVKVKSHGRQMRARWWSSTNWR